MLNHLILAKWSPCPAQVVGYKLTKVVDLNAQPSSRHAATATKLVTLLGYAMATSCRRNPPRPQSLKPLEPQAMMKRDQASQLV